MNQNHPGYRIFILGAGFSRLAGLPLASELFEKIVSDIESHYGKKTKFSRSLDEYIGYKVACDKEYDCSSIDLEDFMSYLDIEHYLELLGSKAWSDEGNESQIMIRKAIGRIIHRSTPEENSLPSEYIHFAECLSLNDYVITFNYDVVLERALHYIGKPYRLFPQRYQSVSEDSCAVDTEVKEVTILKLHGSVDWFDDRYYLKEKDYLKKKGAEKYAKHSIFSNKERFHAVPIVDGLRPKNDPLLHIHRIKDVDEYYKEDRDFHAPIILSPSHVKFVYAEPLLSLWNGLGRVGGYNLGVSIIGFSLPKHDEYIRVVLYKMISNFQESWWDEPLLNILKDYVRIVDSKNNEDEKLKLRRNYSFIIEEKSKYYFNGFSDDAITFLFNETRKA